MVEKAAVNNPPTQQATTVNKGAVSNPAPVSSAAVVKPNDGKPSLAPTSWDYKSDARWGKVSGGTDEQNKGKVWATEADIIQGYHSLEEVLDSKYKPTFQKYSDLEKKFKDNQLDISNLDEYFKSYSEMNSPENPKNQTWEFLSSLIDDDVSAQDFQLAVKKLQEEKLNRKFPGMTQEQRQQAIERDKKLSEMEGKLSAFEHDKNVNENLKVISANEEAIKKLCADKGLEFTDNIKKEFWSYCSEEVKAGRMMINQMPYVFIMKYGTELDRAFENKIKAGSLEAQKQAQAKTVSFAKKPFSPVQNKTSLKDRLAPFFQAKAET